MQNKFKNPALDLMEKQERILRTYNNPALEMQNYTSKFLAGINTDRIYEIERMAQKMCMPQAAMNAIDACTKTISTDGIRQLLETIQKPLTDVSVRLSMLDRLDYSYLTPPAIHNINAMTATMSGTMKLLADTLSVYNTTAFTESFYSSAIAIDSALVNSFEYLHSIIEYFPDETEQALSENPLDMFSEEFDDLDNNDSNSLNSETLQDKLATLTFSEKLKYLLQILQIFINILAFIAAGSKLDVSVDYSKHTERVIVGDTIQETSDTDFNFDISYDEQESPENDDLIAYIESLSQQLDTLTEMVSELEEQENADSCQCDCCDNS
ncbi:hypothetical protein [Anaerotignum sp.]